MTRCSTTASPDAPVESPWASSMRAGTLSPADPKYRHWLEQLAGSGQRTDDHGRQGDDHPGERPPRGLARRLPGVGIGTQLPADIPRRRRVVPDPLVKAAI